MEAELISRSSRIGQDPLSDVLSLLRPRGYMSGGIDAGGDWSFQFERTQGFQCFALLSGSCWLQLEETEAAVRLEAGDFAVLPHGPAFRLASELNVPPIPIWSVIQEPLQGRILKWQGGGSCLGLSAFFMFSGEHSTILSEILPPVVHIRNPADRTALQWYLERMMAVVREPQPGGVLLGEYLAQIMLIEVLRLHLSHAREDAVGWLFALADRSLSAAIVAMHQRPGHRWTVQELAECSGMSRSAFAQRFKQKTGASVMEYLIRWRMMLAADQLLHSGDSIAAIALSLGYESESAFGFAFKREMGRSPRQYGRERAAAAMQGTTATLPVYKGRPGTTAGTRRA